MMLPLTLKALSEGTEVAGIHKYFRASERLHTYVVRTEQKAKHGNILVYKRMQMENRSTMGALLVELAMHV